MNVSSALNHNKLGELFLEKRLFILPLSAAVLPRSYFDNDVHFISSPLAGKRHQRHFFYYVKPLLKCIFKFAETDELLMPFEQNFLSIGGKSID